MSSDSVRASNARTVGVVALATMVVALVLRFFVIPVYQIPSGSMMPTLDRGDRVIVSKLSYTFGDVERGEVVVFDTPPSQADSTTADVFIKRVIGLPGETVRFVDGQVYVDGMLVVEPYLYEPMQSGAGPRRIPGCAQDEPAADRCEVPAGHVFVLGDNRNASDDSRVFGPVAIDAIVGQALVRVWPLAETDRL